MASEALDFCKALSSWREMGAYEALWWTLKRPPLDGRSLPSLSGKAPFRLLFHGLERPFPICGARRRSPPLSRRQVLWYPGSRSR
jgi:hypothetical protein